MTFSYWILGVFVAYFAVLIIVAILRRHMEDMSDYALGGRRMGAIAAALSASSSAASGWTMLVFPALAFAAGLVHLWTVAGIVLGAWFTWTILARRLRRYTIATEDSLTIPEFLEKRFDDRTGVLRTLSAAITIFFIIFYVSSGLIAGAKLLEVVFGIGYAPAILITLVAITSYTFIGGFLAVSRTDVFQSLIMLAGFIILPLTLLVIVDDPLQGIREAAGAAFWNPFTSADGAPVSWLFLLSATGWGLGAFGSQRVLARFMAVDRESHLTTSRNIGLVWIILMFSFGLLLGMVAVPALAEQGMLDAARQDPERVYLLVSNQFFHPLVAGLLLTAVVAAVMSTADSQLLLASAIATDDAPLIKRLTYSIGAHARVWLGRALLVVVGVIAAALCFIDTPWFNNASIFSLVSLAWGGMGAAFGPVLILTLYWRRFNFWGALAAILTGTIVATLWWLMSFRADGIWDIQPATPGFLAALPVAALATLLTPAPSRQVTVRYDLVTSAGLIDPPSHSAA